MAKSWLVHEELCVVFIIFLSISSVFSHPEYYYYQTSNEDNSIQVSFNLKNAESKHLVHKRSAPTEAPTSIQSSSAVPSSLQQSISTTAIVAANTSKVLTKNLGENGAGIRKNYTEGGNATTIRPSLQSPPNITNFVQKKLVDNSTVARNNQTGGDDDEISISKFPEDFNKTLVQHNITRMDEDAHQYYNSTFIINPDIGKQYWISLDNKPNVTINEILSQSHRRAATVKLSFDFPFYGHVVRNLTIATGGFLYTGDYVHSWLAATQYIAPLMANFDTSLSNDSFIKYVDNGTAFTVQWEKVALKDKPKEGEFTFQATLHKSGDIVFVYQSVPLIIENIQEDHHPVKVGLSDAYIIDRTIFFVRRKTIYEYHRVNFKQEDIKNWTVIYLRALPTCLVNKDCNSCLSQSTGFECTWCPSSNRCSNGMDRMRQEWLMKGCDRKQISNASSCDSAKTVHQDVAAEVPYSHDSTDTSMQDTAQASHDGSALRPNDPGKMSVSGILTILFLIAFVAGLGIWILYAYRNPHTASGQMLIRYRPSQWSWKRGEARYTAATIHM